MRFILDNLLLIQETLAWAEYTNQPLLFLKLDFLKAYDMVDWRCLFKIMSAMGFPCKFNSIVKLLFIDTATTIKVNRVPSPLFRIERGVRQGCLLAPYLFLIVAEVLNSMVVKETLNDRVQGSKLPFLDKQQIIAQYADDTYFGGFGG